MTAILITICLLQLYLQALWSLPAPVNLTIHSMNFEHLLRWEPGPGTPPDAMYRICYKQQNNMSTISVQLTLSCSGRYLPLTSNTEMNLTDYLEDVYLEYEIMVQALHNGMVSDWTSKIFTPWTDTVIGPPELSVVGCGNCLQLAIKFPRRKQKGPIEIIYNALQFSISLKKSGEQQDVLVRTSQWNYTLGDLQPGVEYCVQVVPLLSSKQSLRSGWTCAFTSSVAQIRGKAVIPFRKVDFGGTFKDSMVRTAELPNTMRVRAGLDCSSGIAGIFLEDQQNLFALYTAEINLSSPVTGLLVLFTVVLFLGGVVILGLVYTGYLCNQKMRHPRVLTSLAKTYVFEDSVVPVLDSVKFEQESRTKSTIEELQPFKDRFHEKREQRNYEERAIILSSIPRSSQVSHSAGGKTSIATNTTQNSGISSTVASEIQEAPQLSLQLLEGELLNENEGCLEALHTTMHSGSETFENGVEEELEESADVNLLSVTLGALEEDLGAKGIEQTDSILDERHLAITADMHQPFVPISLTESAKLLLTNTSLAQEHCGHILTDCSLTTFAKGYISCKQEEGEGTKEDDDGKCSGYMQR